LHEPTTVATIIFFHKKCEIHLHFNGYFQGEPALDSCPNFLPLPVLKRTFGE